MQHEKLGLTPICTCQPYTLTLRQHCRKIQKKYRFFDHERIEKLYSHGQELFYKFDSNFTNKLVKQLLSMTVYEVISFIRESEV